MPGATWSGRIVRRRSAGRMGGSRARSLRARARARRARPAPEPQERALHGRALRCPRAVDGVRPAGVRGADAARRVEFTLSVVEKIRAIEGIAGIHLMGVGRDDLVRTIVEEAGSSSPDGGRDVQPRWSRGVQVRSGADVAGPGADHLVVRVLLAHVGGPTRHPGGSEDGCHQVRRDAEHVEHRGRVEVHVRVQALLLERGLLDRLGDLVELRLPGAIARLPREPLQHRPARVVRLVDGVTESEDLLVALETVAHVRLRVLRLAHLLEALHRFLVGPAVERSLERSDRGVIAENMSANVDATILAVNVDAFIVWSA